jgi:hypothetical protein
MPHLDLDAFEYSMGLFSVVIGLAVTDVATSFHALMRSRLQVRWDPLTLAVALYTLCAAVYMWFEIWGVRRVEAPRQFFFYLALVGELFVLFLAAAASLPDQGSGKLDLKAYYDENRPYFWSLMTLFQFGYTLFGLYFVRDDLPRMPTMSGVLMVSLMAAPTLVSLALALVRSKLVQYGGVIVLFALMAAHYGAAQIG